MKTKEEQWIVACKKRDADIEQLQEQLKEAVEVIMNCKAMSPLNPFERGYMIDSFLAKIKKEIEK